VAYVANHVICCQLGFDD